MNEKNRKKKSGKARQFPSGHAAARHNALDVILGFTRRREIKKKQRGKIKGYFICRSFTITRVWGEGGGHTKKSYDIQSNADLDRRSKGHGQPTLGGMLVDAPRVVCG